jgi:dienelactone hydrolase
MHIDNLREKVFTTMATLFGIAGALSALWWALFALKPYDITPEQLQARYAYAAPAARTAAVSTGTVKAIMVGETPGWAAELRFESFDGVPALGRIVYPTASVVPAAGQRRPVLLALHGMGRTQWRWWLAEFKGRPTIENTHLLAEQALKQGHVVIALDARGQGDRKDPVKPLLSSELMRGLHLWGEREPYERMIVDTVKDYRVLLDWVVQQPQLDATRIRAAGYSMGAQMALLLAGTDARVHSVAAMVPPHVDNKVAAVSPANVAQMLAGTRVWLLTADDDEYAGAAESAALFAALPGPHKQHLRFEGGHLLPPVYVERLLPWLVTPGAGDSVEAATPSFTDTMR